LRREKVKYSDQIVSKAPIMYEVPAPSRISGNRVRAMCIARAGTSTAACARTLGSVARAKIVIAARAAAIVNTTPMFTSAMKPPIAGPMSMPAMLAACR